MIKLQVLERYQVRGFDLLPGQVVEVDDETAAWLRRDAPGAFVEYTEPVANAPEEPPADKMIKRARRK